MSTKQFSHDHYFKFSMSEPRIAREFLNLYLPKDVIDLVNFDSLAMEKSTFVDSELDLSESDVLFSVDIADEKGFIYILLEHQTNQDRLLPWRLHCYKTRIIEQYFRNYPKAKYLPLVVPLVFYTGKRKYRQPRTIMSLFQSPELVEKYWLGEFPLIELYAMSDDVLRQQKFSGVVNLLMKYIRSRDLVNVVENQVLPLLMSALNKEMDSYFESSVCYALTHSNAKQRDRLVNMLSSSLQAEEKMTSIAQSFINEGYEVGHQEGHKEGQLDGRRKAMRQVAVQMLKNRIELGKVAEITGLSVAQLHELMNEQAV